MSQNMSNGRVTYKDIMEFQEKVFDELTAVRGDIAEVRETQATDRARTKSLLRRDTIGYVWDSINTLATTIVIALWWGRV